MLIMTAIHGQAVPTELNNSLAGRACQATGRSPNQSVIRQIHKTEFPSTRQIEW